MKISEIFNVESDLEFDGIMTHSKKPKKNSVFFCQQGIKYDGHEYIDEAIKNGAICIVHTEKIKNYDPKVLYLKVADVSKTLFSTVVQYYPMINDIKIIGVTGSFGKTSIAHWIQSIASKLTSCGYIGQLGIYYKDVKKTQNFRYDVIELAETLKEMVENGVEYCVMELSTENLALEKLDVIKYHRVIYTNLDLNKDNIIHQSEEAQYLVFTKILKNMTESGKAIINIDDENGEKLIRNANVDIITYGIDKLCDYRATSIVYRKEGTVFSFYRENNRTFVTSNVYGKSSVYNLLGVFATLNSIGISNELILESIKQLDQIPGRMERVDMVNYYLIIVDQAFSVSRFDYVLSSLREINKDQGRLIAVFGSGGNRDVKTRPQLGKIADQYCDLIILTEEDPRNEVPKTIANQIAQGISQATCYFIESRAIAIEQAIAVAGNKDIVVVLGKGDETTMERGLGAADSSYIGDANVIRNIVD